MLLDAIRASEGNRSLKVIRSSIGLDQPKFVAALRRLERRSLVERTHAGGGVSATHVALRSRPEGVVLAVDVGGTKLRAALADAHGQVIDQTVVPTVQSNITEQVFDLYQELLRRSGPGTRVATACVGIPAPYDSMTDSAWNAGNLPVLAGSLPAASLTKALGMPVVVAQDVRLAAVGERWCGHARGLDDFVVICVGTGIGMGIVVNAELYGGGLGGAGEICFLPLGSDPFAPENQVRGPYEEAISGPALARHYALTAGFDDVPDGPLIDARGLFEAAGRGEEKAAAELERAASLLALGIMSVKACLDPGLVVVGGGVGSNPALLGPVRRQVARLTDRSPRIETSPLMDRGPLMGAIAVALGRVPEASEVRRN